MILGDVLATIAVILFSALAAWSGGLLSAILFPARTERAAQDFLERPWVTLFIGLGIMLPIVFIATAIFSVPDLRPFSVVLYVAIIGLAVFGSGGLTRAVAKRVESAGGANSEFAAFAKGGALIVTAELMPVFGWFAIFPYVLISSFGAGVLALFRGRERVPVPAPPRVEAQ